MEFTFYNTSGELTLSGDGVTYSYIGKATRNQIIQPYGSIDSSRYSGYSEYIIPWDGDIIAVVPINTVGTSTPATQSQSGGVWTIRVHNGNNVFDQYGFETEVYTDVYVFGAPAASASSWIMMYDKNGVPSADLSRRPLTCKGLLTMADNQRTASGPPAGLVGILGGSISNSFIYPNDQSGYIAEYRAYGWHYNTSSGQMERNKFTYQAVHSSSNAGTLDNVFACAAVYIDLNGLT